MLVRLNHQGRVPLATKQPSNNPILGPAWINDRANNVLDRLEEIVDYLLDDGLLSQGYLPFETELTPGLLRRMQGDDIKKLLGSSGSVEEQSAILDMLQDLQATVVPEPPV